MFWEYFFDGLAMVISITALLVSIRKDQERVQAKIHSWFWHGQTLTLHLANLSATTPVKIIKIEVLSDEKDSNYPSTHFSGDCDLQIAPKDYLRQEISVGTRKTNYPGETKKTYAEVTTATGRKFRTRAWSMDIQHN